MLYVDPQLSVVVSDRLFVHAVVIFTQAVEPFEKFTVLQLVVFADAIERKPPNIPIRLRLSKSFFMGV
jgi:hypothetical protein